MPGLTFEKVYKVRMLFKATSGSTDKSSAGIC